jgi:hypothetical protein
MPAAGQAPIRLPLFSKSKYSQFESESKQRPLQCRIVQKVVLIVIHIQVAVTEDECVVFMDVHTGGSNDLVCEV